MSNRKKQKDSFAGGKTICCASLAGDEVDFPIPASEMERVSIVVAELLGLHFPQERWEDLRRGIDAATRELGYVNKESLFKQLALSTLTRREIDVLAGCLTVGETYFYREPQVLDAVSRKILPDLIEAKRSGNRSLRIWSAGCCTGEEPYTIAMMIDRLVPDRRRWDITILATDINQRFLEKASSGIYRSWSFRSCPPWIMKYYCEPIEGDRIRISGRIQNMVDFSYLNLAQDPYPSLSNNTIACDIIFCRNVFMYFDDKIARRVMRGFHRSLVKGGWLITSVMEVAACISEPFFQEKVGDVTLLRKAPEKSERELSYRLAPCALLDTLPRLESTPSGMRTIRAAPAAAKRVRTADKLHGEAGDDRRESRVSTVSSVLESTYTIACDLYKGGRYDEVLPILVPLIRDETAQGGSGKQRAKVMALMARAEANRGELSTAMLWAEKALTENRSDAGIRYLLAGVLFESGRTVEAAKMLRAAIFLDQDFVLAHFALGNLAHREGNVWQRNKRFNIALSLLRKIDDESILPESDGMTAGSLRQIIETMMETF